MAASSGNFNLVLTDNGVGASADVNCTPTGACCNCLPSPFDCTVETALGCADLAGSYKGDFSQCLEPFGPVVRLEQVSGAPIDSALPIATSVLTVGAANDCLVADVDVEVSLSHTFMGDLILAVEHGPALLLIDSQCGATPGGIHSTANDEGTDLTCLGIANGPAANVHYPPAIGGMGDDVLAIYDAAPSGGAWTLTVLDQFGGDTGTLDSWAIIFQCGVPICPSGTTGGKDDDSSSASSDDQFDGRPFGVASPANSGAASEWSADGASPGGSDTNDEARAPRSRKIRTRGE